MANSLPEPPNIPTNLIDSPRRKLITAACESWVARLIDVSRRNNLLYFRELKTGTLDLSIHESDIMTALLAGKPIIISGLVPNTDEAKLTLRVREIQKRAMVNLEEKGLETLFLAMGMATWQPSDSGRPPEAAVLLVPVTIEMRALRSPVLRRQGEARLNPVLLHVLEEEFHLTIDEALVELTESDEAPLSPPEIFTKLNEIARELPGFTIRPRVVLGNFAFQKLAMVNDLQASPEDFIANDIIGAIVGDEDARNKLAQKDLTIDLTQPDQMPSEHEFLVYDADASQHRVINAVLAEQNGVIQGPPGTGKSQTITNLIATLAAKGKRVLFVAEKRAALEVVIKRLNVVGLGHLALDLHRANFSRREIIEQFATSLELVRKSRPVEDKDLHKRFVERRTALNKHVARWHVKTAPTNLSLYQLQNQLYKLAQFHSTTRWQGEALNRLNSENAVTIKDLLTEGTGFASFLLRTDSSAWTGSQLTDWPQAQRALQTAEQLTENLWPPLLQSLQEITQSGHLKNPNTIAETSELLQLLNKVNALTKLYSDAIFKVMPDDFAMVLAPAKQGLLAKAWAWCSNKLFRRTLSSLKALRQGGRVDAAQIYDEVKHAAELVQQWEKASIFDETPRAINGVDVAEQSLKTVEHALQLLNEIFPDRRLREYDFAYLTKLSRDLAADSVSPRRLPRLSALEDEITKLGAKEFLNELRSKQPATNDWSELFENAWLNSCVDELNAQDPTITGFHGRVHDKFVDEFCRLDREKLLYAAARVSRAHAENVIQTMNQHPGQEALVRREVSKKIRHLSLRKLLSHAPHLLTALRPCWMASPLSVSQLLTKDNHLFDVVIFDEASQVLPEEAIPALLRGKHVVVAGDRHQLPPTIFFADGSQDEESETDNPIEGFESLLDLLNSFLPSWQLNWHYRSRDEALIAFSNHNIYHSLVTFPGIGGPPAIKHQLVTQTTTDEEEAAQNEAQAVIDLVLQFATKYPAQSLGVITMGIKHARRIELLLDKILPQHPALAPFFIEDKEDAFFIKNLERVQGDERDHIILTTGYVKNSSGRIDYRQFGPLLTEGGERRLNVAITRARRSMTLITSFDHHDIAVGRTQAYGVDLFRNYLIFIDNFYKADKEKPQQIADKLADKPEYQQQLNSIEQDIFSALTAAGLEMEAQWGNSEYCIDMVVHHPQQKGRYVLAIECDGANYGTIATARDRDRLRQQQLEALGWRYHRLWLADWLLRRDEEIARVLKAYQAAIEFADQKDREPQIVAPISNSVTQAKAPLPDSPPSQTLPIQTLLAQTLSAQTLIATLNSNKGRGPRPQILDREEITDYSEQELQQLIVWINSDEKLRSDDEVIDEVVKELNFKRRGARIERIVLKVLGKIKKT